LEEKQKWRIDVQRDNSNRSPLGYTLYMFPFS
jgi:hypothetical protein